MISVERVAAVLRPWLGAHAISHCPVSERAHARLLAFDSANGDFEALHAVLDRQLFMEIDALTQGDMRLLMDDGRFIRVRLSDFYVMADELMYLVYARLPRTIVNCDRLRTFALSHSSLSALRALCVDFAQFQTAEEKAVLERTARACHPAYRWRQWLRPSDA